MRALVCAIFVSLLMLPGAVFSAEKGLTVHSVRHFSYPAFTRIVFEVEAAAPYVVTKTGDGKNVLFSSYDGPFVVRDQLPVIRDGIVSGIESNYDTGKDYIIIHLDREAGEVKDFVLRDPDRIVIDIQRRGSAIAPVQPGQPQTDKPVQPDKPRLTDKLVIVILDPGHGGRDTGIAAGQGQEKTVTLEIAQAIRKILQKNQRLKVFLTREKDQFLSLEERTAESNSARGMIFVSIHGSPGANGRVYIYDGQEIMPDERRRLSTDFLGFEADNEQRERFWGKQQEAYAKESAALGRAISHQFMEGAGPVQAPLAGLRAVEAAAVVVEVGMDRDRLKSADAVARGIEQYVGENR